jgi:hypothetical protein
MNEDNVPVGKLSEIKCEGKKKFFLHSYSHRRKEADPLDRDTDPDPRIRIRIKMSRIPNAGFSLLINTKK